MTGSRSGGIIAAAWSAMVHMGEEGYIKAVNEMWRIYQQLIEGFVFHQLIYFFLIFSLSLYVQRAETVYFNMAYLFILNYRINQIRHLKVMTHPDACNISMNWDPHDQDVKVKSISILKVADAMAKRGWKNINRIQHPVGYFHLLITYFTKWHKVSQSE
jgi:hypothetical protein